ncbi:GNAT family protein [uncultured Bacteroides sp.]|uniref:GNAT family N-acetyltransferase n=1 Tax=uncultured Bacteroides sp. TaxID=162156 RepID=UPI00260D87B7|nr:GNAT family protein [uncultured Bacteroides sp.]
MNTQHTESSETRIYSACIRPWRKEDVAALTDNLNNKKIWDNCRDSLPYPYTEKDAVSFIHYAMLQSEQNEFCIEVEGEAAGNISFTRGTDVERFNAEVGYWLAEKYWGKGITTRMLREAVRIYFNQTDVERLFADVYETNEASMRVLEEVGFHRIGLKRRACYKNGRFLNAYSYELLRTDFATCG